MTQPPAPRLVEVGPRDGLQNEKETIPVDAKVAFVNTLSRSGLREIEAGAFVSPKAVPQMADSAKVFDEIERKEGVIYSALVPNSLGLDRALEAEADKVAVFTAASETFNLRNISCSIAESIQRFKPVIERAQKARLPLRAYVSTAFFCPYEGAIAPDKVIPVVDRLCALGVKELSIGDTIGRASPRDVRALLDVLLKRVRVECVFLHFHDTYGMAIANALTAWQEYGVYGFDASTGGVGGCPYAPGAGGNVAMEDLVFAFGASGADVSSINVNTLQDAGSLIEKKLGHLLPSRLSKIELR